MNKRKILFWRNICLYLGEPQGLGILHEINHRHHQAVQTRRRARSHRQPRRRGADGFRGQGFGRQKGHTELYRGAEYQVDFLPKVKLEIATLADNVEQIIEAISKAAHTGKIGDGKIFVYDLQAAVRIRTGETDADAL